jgi:hypothetical protein
VKRRYAESNADHFDLLPFIAILMCLLGCLLLVTLSIAALSLGAGVGEGWIPTSDSTRPDKTPILIEWDGKTATIHRQGRKLQVKWEPALGRIDLSGSVDLSKLSELLSQRKPVELDPQLKTVLEELATQRDTHYALFAVRPSGFENFEEFADLFRDRQINVGYEPLKQEKTVRLLQERKQP